MNIHDVIKLYKHGYSKVTDHASREIRFNRLSRKDGINLVKKYELTKPLYLNLFCEWLGIREKSLDYIFDRIKNPKFWLRKDVKKYKKNLLSSKIKNKNLKKTKTSKIKFIKNSKLNENKKPGYIIIGKGYDN